MDERMNPYAPGAGTPPPELAGRERGHGKRSPLEPRVRYDSIRLDIPLHHAR